MSRSLGVLTLDLVLRTGMFKEGMDRAARETQRGMARIESSIRSAQRGFALFTRGLGALGVGFGVTSIIRGFTDSAKAAIEFGDEVQKAVAKTGIAAEAFSELAHAAKQNDIELAALGTAFKKMQQTVSEAGSGTKSALELFRALGLELEELRKLAPDKQFELLADRIDALKDPADRTRAAVELFGRAGADLLPLFEDGAAGIRAAREEAQRLGATLTGEQAQALAAADDSIKRLSASYDGFTRTITANVAPTLAEFFDNINERITSQAPYLERAADAWVEYFDVFRKGPVGLAVEGIGLLTGAAREAKEAIEAIPEPPPLLGTGLAPGGRNRAPFVPGFLAPEASTAATRSGARPDPAPYLRELAIDTQRITVAATEQLYRDMDAATQTSMQRQLAEWENFEAQVQALVEAGRISQEDALARNAEKTDEFLQEIEITAERMTVPVQEAIEETSEFAKQAARNMQDAFADFLFDPFDEGLEGMLEGFADTLRRMAAEVVAAQIAEKFNFEDLFKGGGIFGGGGGGTFGSGPQGGGAIGLAPIDITAQRLPEAGAVLGGAAESTAAATALGTAITTAGTAAATAFTAAGTTAATALTAAGTTVAAAITTAGTAAAAAIGAAGAAGGAASGLSEILITATRMEKGGYLAPGQVALVGESRSGQAAPELLLAGRTSAALQQFRPTLAAGQARIAGASTTSRQAPELVRAGPAGITVIPLREHLRERELLSRSDRHVERLLERPPVRAPEIAVDARSAPVMHLDRELFAGYFASGGYIPPGRFGVVGDSMSGQASRELLVSGQVSGSQTAKAPTVTHNQFVFPGFTGQLSRQTEMQLTAAAARGARQADRHNN